MKLRLYSQDGLWRSFSLVRVLTCVFLLLLQALEVEGAAFQNLDFESSPLLPVTNRFPPTIYPNALPGWTVHIGNTIQDGAYANDFILDDPGVALSSVEYPGIPVISGHRSVYLQSVAMPQPIFFPPSRVEVSISQVGDVPIGAERLSFDALNQWYDSFPIPPGPFEVSLGGTILPLFPESSNGSLVQYAANIAPWAGQTAELSIKVLATSAWGNTYTEEGWAVVDNIHFDPIPAPEPSAVALIGLSGLLLVSSVLVKRSRNWG